MSLVDQTISHDQEYRIEDLVYDGAMVALYRGRWERLDQTIYISVLQGLDSLKLTRKAIQRIRDNLHENVGRIQHPNLPDVIDYGEGDILAPFTIMRLPPGRLLVHRLAEEPLGTLETYQIVRDVASALKACRQAGIPHRGPAAHRIWVTEEGRAILLGLGEVLYRHDSFSMSGPRRAELVWHLPPEAYPNAQAPEQQEEDPFEPPDYRQQLGGGAAKSVEDDESAEVFALGALTYHCLAGHHPYFAVRTAPSSGIATLITGTRLELENRVLRESIDVALSQAPADRFPTVDDYVSDLAERLRIPPDEHQEPSFVNFRHSGDERSQATAETDDVEANGVTQEASRTTLYLWRIVALLLFIALLAYAYLDLRRPTSVLITSTPPGLELTEVTGHLEENRGRTPVILTERNANTDLVLKALGPNGEEGPAVHINPASFQDLGRCRRVHLDANFRETEGSIAAPNVVPAEVNRAEGDVEQEAAPEVDSSQGSEAAEEPTETQ